MCAFLRACVRACVRAVVCVPVRMCVICAYKYGGLLFNLLLIVLFKMQVPHKIDNSLQTAYYISTAQFYLTSGVATTTMFVAPRFCCHTKPELTLRSDGQKVMILFRSNYTFPSNRTHGFKIRLHAGRWRRLANNDTLRGGLISSQNL